MNAGFPFDFQHDHAAPQFQEPTHEELYPPLPPRRRRGGLEADIESAIHAMLAGEWPMPDAPLTPYRLSCAVRDRAELSHRPSTGGVTDVLKRWVKIGAVTTRSGPFAFDAFTPAYAEHGLIGLHERAKAPQDA